MHCLRLQIGRLLGKCFKSFYKGALAKIFVKKILLLKGEEKLWFIIKYITLEKKKHLTLKTFPSKCIFNKFFACNCKQVNMFIHVECWTLIIAFQTENTPEKKTFILFIINVTMLVLERRGKKTKNTANCKIYTLS